MYIYIYICIYIYIYIYIYVCIDYMNLYDWFDAWHVGICQHFPTGPGFASPSCQRGHHPKCHGALHSDGHHVEEQHVQDLKKWITIWVIQHFLVAGWPTPLKNMSSSIGMMTVSRYGTIKVMFQSPPASFNMIFIQLIQPSGSRF